MTELDIPKNLDCQRPKLIDRKYAVKSALFRLMGKFKNRGLDELAAQGFRLALVRKVCGDLTQTGMALKLGISVQRWSNFENGMRLSSAVALMIVQKCPGFTRDYLLDGNEMGLPQRLIADLHAAADALERNNGVPSRQHKKKAT
jgi:hypothetical protein